MFQIYADSLMIASRMEQDRKRQPHAVRNHGTFAENAMRPAGEPETGEKNGRAWPRRWAAFALALLLV